MEEPERKSRRRRSIEDDMEEFTQGIVEDMQDIFGDW